MEKFEKLTVILKVSKQIIEEIIAVDITQNQTEVDLNENENLVIITAKDRKTPMNVTCSICHEGFQNESKLSRHKSRVHTPKVPPLPCRLVQPKFPHCL